MFDSVTYDGNPLTDAYAVQRVRNEPIVEMTQVKGTSKTHVAGGSFTERNYWSKVGIVDGTAKRRGSVPSGGARTWEGVARIPNAENWYSKMWDALRNKTPPHPDLPKTIQERAFLVAGTVGLIHGLGFAGALREIGLPEGTELLALLMFNLGVEAGQLAVLGLLLALLLVLRKLATTRAAHVEIFAAYALGTIGTYWMLERIGQYFA